MRNPRLLAFLVVVSLATLISSVDGQQVDPSLLTGLRWRMIGPFRGGRSNAVAGIESQPNVYYFGSVGGGVWKTTNGGETWEPIFDGQPIASVGALAIAPLYPLSEGLQRGAATGPTSPLASNVALVRTSRTLVDHLTRGRLLRVPPNL